MGDTHIEVSFGDLQGRRRLHAGSIDNDLLSDSFDPLNLAGTVMNGMGDPDFAYTPVWVCQLQRLSPPVSRPGYIFQGREHGKGLLDRT